jgi:hypothetical protein
MRGHCGPINRAIRDARHIAKPLSQVKILLDHDGRRRRVICGMETYTVTVPQRVEDFQLTVD